MKLEEKQKITANWFAELRDRICLEFEKIEEEFGSKKHFEYQKWEKDDAVGGGTIGIMKGDVFEKVGVNISTIKGSFKEEFRSEIPGTEESSDFFATGISLVAHMTSPLVPAVHFNTRFLNTSRQWFGGGADLNPAIEFKEDTEMFHQAYKICCDSHNSEYYSKFKKWCDEYFFIKHRNQARGVGGIFYDYLDSDFSKDFAFTKEVGLTFLETYPKLVRRRMRENFSTEEKEIQLYKRGLYAEFNLIYDRGTRFGLMTNGNIDAILMSLPPIAKWK